MPTAKTPLAQRARSHVLPLTTKFNLADYDRVRSEAAAHGVPVSAYLRQKTLTGSVQPQTIIHPICEDQWRYLAPAMGNLNRLLFLLNSGALPDNGEIRGIVEAALVELKAVRRHLAGEASAA